MSKETENRVAKDNIDELATVVTSVFTVAFFAIFIAGSYFGRGSIEHLLSFMGNDTPGSFPGSVFPKPIGVHYFGDYLLPRWQSIRPSPWFESDIHATPITNYLPFTMAIFAALSMFPYWKSFILLTVISLFLIIRPLWLSKPRKYRLRMVTSLVLLTGPFISLIDRGNIQLPLIGLLLSALYLYKNGHSRWGAFLLGLAIAIKGYPILLLVVWMKARKWLEVSIALVTALFLTIVPLLIYDGGLMRNIYRILRNINLNDAEYAHSALAYNSSFKGLLLSVASMKIPAIDSASLFLFRHFAVVSVLIIVVCIFLGLKSEIDLFETTLLSVVLMTTMFGYVAPYVLGLYFLPLLFLGDWKPNLASKNRDLIFICWAIVMAPKGIPLQFWNTSISGVTPTFTSLFGGLAGMTILFCLIRTMYKSWRQDVLFARNSSCTSMF